MTLSRAQQSDFGTAEDRELYVDNLRVYREWHFGDLGPWLTGLNRSVIWTGGSSWSSAQCFKGGYYVCETAPSPECTCGFYGWYRPYRLWEGGRALFGVAEVAGTSVLGSLGLRAQKMRPLGIVLSPGRFGCGCELCQRAAGDCGDDPGESLMSALDRSLPGVGAFASKAELLEAFPPSDWESIVGPIPAYEAPPSPFAHLVAVPVGLHSADLRRAMERMAQQLAKAAAVQPAPAPAPALSSAQQAALDARRRRNTGPGWLRDPFRRRGGGSR